MTVAIHDANKYTGTLRVHKIHLEQWEAMSRAAENAVRMDEVADAVDRYVSTYTGEAYLDRAEVEQAAALAIRKKYFFMLVFDELRKAGFVFDGNVPKEPVARWVSRDEHGEAVAISYSQGEDAIPA